jgi:hypothetical protein
MASTSSETAGLSMIASLSTDFLMLSGRVKQRGGTGMAKTLATRIEIEAPKEKVWGILTDFAAYPQWNPFIKSISGEARVGAKLDVHLQPPRAKGITLHPQVLSAIPGQELRWLGHLVVPGIFDGEHHLLIQEESADRVTFVQEETFKGVLIPFTGKMLDKTEQGFVQMNEALKSRAEAI